LRVQLQATTGPAAAQLSTLELQRPPQKRIASQATSSSLRIPSCELLARHLLGPAGEEE